MWADNGGDLSLQVGAEKMAVFLVSVSTSRLLQSGLLTPSRCGIASDQNFGV